MNFENIHYIVSGTFASGVNTNISESGKTYYIKDYGLPKPSQQWVGSAFTTTSNENGVEKGIEACFKFDENNGGQLDVYARQFIRFNGKTWKEKNYLSKKLHHPQPQISGSSTIFPVYIEGITRSGLSIIRVPKNEFKI